MRVVVLLAMVTLTACGLIQPAPVNVNGGDATIAVGKSVPYRLYTHCGVRSASINGRTFFADPPLGDGSANPPGGWGNPFDDGTMTLVTSTSADFSDLSGHRAHFTATPNGPTPSIGLCD